VLILIPLIVGFMSVRSQTTDTTETSESSNGADSGGEAGSIRLYPVVWVYDGDTISVRIDDKVETVRLIGIDTPEVDTPYTELECFGQEASLYLRDVLRDGSVRLESDSTAGNRDRYDRLLRYVFLADGTHVNENLVAKGYAVEYTYDSPYRYQAEFLQAQQDARDSQKGLWSLATCAKTTALGYNAFYARNNQTHAHF